MKYAVEKINKSCCQSGFRSILSRTFIIMKRLFPLCLLNSMPSTDKTWSWSEPTKVCCAVKYRTYCLKMNRHFVVKNRLSGLWRGLQNIYNVASLWKQNLWVVYEVVLGNGPGKLSRHSEWLRARQWRNRISSPSKGKIFLLFTSSRPVLKPIQIPIKWVPGTFLRG
jgi:hypothetical protein